MATVRHLGFVGRVYGPLTMSVLRYCVGIDAAVLITCRFQYLRVRFEKAYSRPEMVVCGFSPAK